MKVQKRKENYKNLIQKALNDANYVDLHWIDDLSTQPGWHMAPDSLKFIFRLIAHVKPQHILEFGTGMSTYVMAKACTNLNRCCYITSIDHDPEFGEAIAKTLLTSIEPNYQISFQFAPIVARNFGGKNLPAYHIKGEHLSTDSPVDLVLIDGPPRVLGGREGIFYQVMDFARPGTITLLDDANRS